jgi:hypothetical protein
MTGQVIYHLLAAVHAVRAPWPVTMLVSCIPVITLGFGAALTHLLRTDLEPVRAAGLAPGPDPDAEAAGRTGAPSPETRTDKASGLMPVTREQVVASLAGEIRDAIEAGERWQPDYPALMQQTGFRRSWCEKAVRDARTAAAFPASAETRVDDAPGARTEPLALVNGSSPVT